MTSEGNVEVNCAPFVSRSHERLDEPDACI